MSTEILRFPCPTTARHWPWKKVPERRSRLARRRTLRSVVARFKPGDADEILSVPGRELRHEGVLLKANKLGKLVRHYFLFNDLLLTAEALKGSRATSWISSHTGGLSGPAEAQHEAEALQLRKCKALAPTGGHLILPMEGKDDSFELHLPLAETTSKLWAASVEERSVWISQLRQVLLESRFPPATAMLPRRLCYAAIDGGAREEGAGNGEWYAWAARVAARPA